MGRGKQSSKRMPVKTWNFKGSMSEQAVFNREVEPEKKTPPKIERTPEEKARLKRELLLNMNNYHVGSHKNAKLDKLYNHIFQGDGDYLIVNNRIGNFIVKMNEAKRPGLPEEFKGSKLELKVPKIPQEIYYQILAFFRDIADTMGNAEAFIQVYYDVKDRQYVCHVPEQEVAGASVSYDATENLNNKDRERYISVFEIHSHNTMGAFWSGTDDADEKETKFYGVFGKIKDETIEEKFRFMVMGKQVDLKKEHIFDFSEDDGLLTKEELMEYIAQSKEEKLDVSMILRDLRGMPTDYPPEWKEKVKTKTYVTHSYVGGRAATSYGDNEGYGNTHYPGKSYKARGWEDWENSQEWWDDATGAYKNPGKSKGESQMAEYNDDAPQEDGVDIDELFDINEYEEEMHSAIIEAFVYNLNDKHVNMLMEYLVEYGHDPLIQQFQRQ